jgi:hypothetical protein
LAYTDWLKASSRFNRLAGSSRELESTLHVSSVYLAGGTPLGAIFLSYRRSDAAGEAGRLSDDLIARFGQAAVFMDVDAIKPGLDFRVQIWQNVGACSVLLALIGPSWLECESTLGSRRIDSTSDYVRLEISAALQRGIPVVPVLVRAARMPKADMLPNDLRDLAYRHSVELTHARWKSDVQLLMDALAGHVQGGRDRTTTHDRAGQTAGIPIDEAAVHRVTHELACYIGPIAEVVVKRAARQCSTLPELCAKVSQEIEAGPDRVSFLATCHR